MDIITRHEGDVVILDLKGKLTIGKGDVRLRGELMDQLESGKKNILVNLAEHDAEVKLLHVNLKARKLLTMAQLVGVFEMFDDEKMAIESFKA